VNSGSEERGRPSLRYVAELDGIRGLAIAAVMALHFLCTQLVPQNLAERIIGKVTSYGGWGVDLFFVLSGFLITGILYDTKSSANYLRSFYGRRTLRIFPLYYGVLLVGMLLLPESVARSLDPELLQARRVQGWLWTYLTNVHLAITGWFTIPYVSHFWSLAVEEHFYLVWPFVVRAVSRRALMITCAAVVLGAVVLRAGSALLGVNEVATYTLTPYRLDPLCAGAFFALWARGPAPDPKRLIMWPWIVAGAIVLVSILRANVPASDRVLLALREGLVAVFFGLFVASAARPVGSPGWRRFLRSRLLSFLGKYSYGLYVFHGIVSYAWSRADMVSLLTRALGSRGFALIGQAVLGVSLSTALAVASYQLYEKRFLQLKRLFEAAPTSRAADQVPGR
jgi:peptidoglycan/LPS O-acetylase OafA/YrhL